MTGRLILAAAILLFASPSLATDPCARAAELRAEITDLLDQIDVIREESRPQCKARTKRCRELLAELHALQAHAERLNAERHTAETECRRAAR